MRRAALIATAAALAGCGGSSHSTATTTAATPAAMLPGGKTLYRGGPWAVVVKGDQAVAAHLAGTRWVADRTGAVKVTFLGPRGTVGPQVQVAAAIAGGRPLVESGLWVDGEELLAKGGGLTPTKGTIYGTTRSPLAAGEHVAVAYARTATHATAIALAFRVGNSS